MDIPGRFSQLPDYTFDRLRLLIGNTPPGDKIIDMSIGAPRHAFPQWIMEEITGLVDQFGKYPPKNGTSGLLQSISSWYRSRYGATIDPDENISVVNGTREALFNACIALCPEHKKGKKSKVLIPNPFYQVYVGAALAANAEPVFLDAEKSNNFLPDFERLSHRALDEVAIVYLCSPSNPQGSVASREYMENLLKLAHRHDFLVFSDECYSEIYRSKPPPSMIEASSGIEGDLDRMMIFNSLSKRSNLPGLRAGFMVGGEKLISHFKKYRSYSDPAVPIPLQAVATRLLEDESHVSASREQYQAKYKLADRIFDGFEGYNPPEAGFFLWLDVEDGEQITRRLWKQRGVKVVPGSYFSFEDRGLNPGKRFIRVAMVAGQEELETGLASIRELI
ncbi:MAG: aminotransferase class I/II-fold pyridoxal phosphate-dependent enzyme [Rhodobacteraceae bacterium]|nr:aminotransferase class I/II-fold pyridoxal phosphate-dependent enzyme [Paracoccaceae bacterium]MCY4249612.1 aminotransferase class I/II-fold pyridoxal phosphate-dependent enzyme [Paracoccaceae bacterium]